MVISLRFAKQVLHFGMLLTLFAYFNAIWAQK